MSFFSSKKNPEINLILDIGNGSIGGALVLMQPGQKPEIIFTKRLPLSIPDRSHRDKLPSLVLTLLTEVMEGTSKGAVDVLHKLNLSTKKVNNTFCVISAPWFVSKTKILSIKNPTPLSISKAFVEDLLQKEEEIFKNEVATRKSGALSPDDISTVEKKIIQTKLNGYSTDNPYQKKAKEIDVAMFLSVSSKEFMHSLEKVIGKYFYSKHTIFHSFSLIEHNVINDIFINDSNFAFLDISAEVTEVAAVEDRVLMETASFPLGRNFIVQKVAENFGVNPEIALSNINLYREGHLDATTKAKTEAALELAKNEWGKFFEYSMHEIIEQHIPAKIFITVDEDVDDFFSSCIRNIYSSVPVVVLNNSKLSEYVKYTPGVLPDSFLCMEAIFFSKLLSS
jgi:hypothetical protein